MTMVGQCTLCGALATSIYLVYVGEEPATARPWISWQVELACRHCAARVDENAARGGRHLRVIRELNVV